MPAGYALFLWTQHYVVKGSGSIRANMQTVQDPLLVVDKTGDGTSMLKFLEPYLETLYSKLGSLCELFIPWWTRSSYHLATQVCVFCTCVSSFIGSFLGFIDTIQKLNQVNVMGIFKLSNEYNEMFKVLSQNGFRKNT